MSSREPGLHGGHILVDFDGTLATHTTGHNQHGVVGDPIPVMVAAVRRWLGEGREVRIFTARVWSDGTDAAEQSTLLNCMAIQDWCLKHLGRNLQITCEKSWAADALFDDRAYQVVRNEGVILPPHPVLGN